MKSKKPMCSSQNKTIFLLSKVTKLPKFVPISRLISVRSLTNYDVPSTGALLLFFDLFLDVTCHILEVLKFTVVLHF